MQTCGQEDHSLRSQVMEPKAVALVCQRSSRPLAWPTLSFILQLFSLTPWTLNSASVHHPEGASNNNKWLLTISSDEESFVAPRICSARLAES